MALTKVPSNLDATIATTQSQADNSTNIATTAYVDLAISNLSDSAPAALNTLNEIAAALGDDANYASTTTAAIAAKLPLAGGTMTGNLVVTSLLTLAPGSTNHTNHSIHANSNGYQYHYGGANGLYLGDNSDLSNAIGIRNANFIDMQTGGVERMRIDASGNVGIGTTPKAYHSDYKAIDINNSASVMGYTGNNGAWLMENLYFGTDGNWKHKNSDFSAMVEMYDGVFNVYNTASGTAGATATLQNRLKIDSSGKVGINDTNPSQMLSVSGTGSVPPARFTATGNTNTLEVWGNATASTSTGILCNAGTNSNDYSAKFRNYAGSTIMEVRGDSLVDTFGGIRLQDSNILALGDSSDTRLYYDGTDSLYITAVNGTANNLKTSANNTYIMQANGNQLITAIANSEVIINNDSSASIDFRVESDNEQYNFFCDASSEIIHFGEGTNSDVQSVIPAKTLAGRRHGYHGGNKQHAGQTFKYSEGTSWTDAIKIDWHNVSWGAVCMRITGQYYYGASNNFSVVIGFSGYGEVNNSSYGHTSVSYDATSSGVETWTNAIQLAQTANGETTIRQRAGDSTGDIIYRYEWQCYARSNQPILIIDL